MISVKPLILPQKPERPARKPKRMTIAIGMLCNEGLIIAADTMASLSDGTTRQAVKIHEVSTDSFACVVANATGDGNAVNTLVPDILANLRNKVPLCFADAEKSIRNSMFQWADQFRQGSPDTQLIIGVSINRPVHSDMRLGGGVRLYYCEPPNTMFPVERDDASSGYVGAGMGASITDPIFRTLFGMEVSMNVALRQIAYLMYRAKKDAASSCGGETNAIALKSGSTLPLWIEPRYMTMAESFGKQFDYALHVTADTFLAETDEGAGMLWEANKSYLENMGGMLRQHSFLTSNGEDVGE